MSFELTVMDNTPMASDGDLQDSLMLFLTQIGYLSENYQPRTANALSKSESVPYQLFSNCFLNDMCRGWKVDELTKKLKTTPPTIYRHINKLLTIGILDHSSADFGEAENGNIYRLKFGNLSIAWKIVEANVDSVKSIYRKAVDSIEDKIQSEFSTKKTPEKASADAIKKGRERANFRITVVDRILKITDKYDETLAGLLMNIGYLERGGQDLTKVKKSVPYKLFLDCFMKRRDKQWDAESLTIFLKTSKPTIYRHLNKLLSLGLLEATPIGENYPLKVGYRMRYGNFAKAWYFVENRMDSAMRNYRKTIDSIQAQIIERGN